MPFCEMRSGGRPAMFSPLNRTRPDVGPMTPVRQLKKVLLPAPFGPMMARISPRWTSKSTLLSALRPPKRTVSASVRRTGALPRSTPAEEDDWGGGAADTYAYLRAWRFVGWRLPARKKAGGAAVTDGLFGSLRR